MTLEALKQQVMRCIDETPCTGGALPCEQFPLEEMLADAGRQLLLTAPAHVFTHPSDFSAAVPVDHGDGTGSVALPEGFLRLLSFRMQGWQRPVTVLHDTSGTVYRRQFNPCTRGGTAKPVAVRDGARLLYFSLPAGTAPRIAEALCITETPVDSTAFPAALVRPLVWLAAARVLQVTAEPQAAQLCLENASEHLKSL